MKFIILSILSFSVFVQAANLNYLSKKAVDPEQFLPNPPPLGSEEEKSETQTLLTLQNQRTQEQEARCKDEARMPISNYQSVIGDCFTESNLPLMTKLINNVDDDLGHFTKAGKDFFARPRPFVSHSEIRPVFPDEKGYSYPSGHATYSEVNSMILSQIVDGVRSDLLERGRQIGWDRVICGVHYPSDIEAGRVYGLRLYNQLIVDKTFQKDLAAAQDEFKQVCKRH